MGFVVLTERPLAEGLDLGVEGRADPADLALADRSDAEGVDEVLHPPGADAQHIGLLDDREQRPLGPAARLERDGKYKPSRTRGMARVHGPDPGVPASVAIPVPLRQPPLRVAFALGHAGQFESPRLP